MSDQRPVGRPSSYEPAYAAQAQKLCQLGATDKEIADFFGVSTTTITNWKSDFPEFLAALKTGKAESDERVERSLFHRAIGYTFDSEKVFQFQGQIVRAKTVEHVPPDTTACIFWLKNRRRDAWRDVQLHEVGKPGDFEKMNADELRGHIAAEAAELGLSHLAPKGPRGKGASNGSGRAH